MTFYRLIPEPEVEVSWIERRSSIWLVLARCHVKRTSQASETTTVTDCKCFVSSTSAAGRPKTTLTLCSQAPWSPTRLFSLTVGIQLYPTKTMWNFNQPNFAIWVLESAKLVAWQHSFCMAAWQPWGRVLCGHQFWAVTLWSCNVADVALQHVNQESLGRCFVSRNLETSFIM